MKSWLFLFSFFIGLSVAGQQKPMIEATLDRWHKAAAHADNCDGFHGKPAYWMIL